MEREVIIETDLGHDPDDFFAICWLVAKNVKIKALTLTPGDIDQIAIARFLRKEFHLDFPIGVSKLDREKYSSGGMYYDLLRSRGLFGKLHTEKHNHDGEGCDVISQAWDETQDFLIIGPATNMRKFIEKTNLNFYTGELVMQGGFLPYSQNPYNLNQLDKFKGLESVGTFNFNGDHKAINKICETKFHSKKFIGKHICHGVIINKDIERQFDYGDDAASELFKEGMRSLFNHTDSKKFHDPLAALELFYGGLYSPLEFIKGRIFHTKGGWTTTQDSSSDCQIAADIDQDYFWQLFGDFNE